MTFDVDVTIIGAGPIGSFLAYELASNNLNVCLIEKKRVVGLPLQCAGIVNKEITNLIDLPNDLILNKSLGANLHSKNHSLTVSKNETQAYIIDRVALDQYLFEKVKNLESNIISDSGDNSSLNENDVINFDFNDDSLLNGNDVINFDFNDNSFLDENNANSKIKIYLSSKVTEVDSKLGIVKFKSASKLKEIKSKIIVGADGPLSLSSQTIGNSFKNYNASQYLVKVNNIEEMSFVDLYARGDLFPGFIWQIPVYKNIFRIGLFSNDGYKKQSNILNKFLEEEFKYDDYEILEKYKGKIPIYNKENKLFKDRVLLIGDAASQLKPTTGGGLLIGFQAVKFAKETIINGLNNLNLKYQNNCDLNDLDNDEQLKILSKYLKKYQDDFEKRFSKEFEYQLKVQKTLCTLSDDDLDYFFIKLKEKEADELISEYGDMDNQSKLVKEFIKRGLIFSLLPVIHKKELAKIWLL